MKLIISNMVCQRCILVTEGILAKLGFTNFQVQLGQIKIAEMDAKDKLAQLKIDLKAVGFEIVEDKTEKIIESIKAYLVAYLNLDKRHEIKMSSYLSDNIYYDYSYLSDIFSRMENKTIEKYYIELRLDRAKELIKYSNKDFNTIAYELGYSSPQHFASQFKQYFGITRECKINCVKG